MELDMAQETSAKEKFIPCGKCNKTGKETVGGQRVNCIQCNGRGQIDLQRYTYLTEKYWPGKRGGKFTDESVDENINLLHALWEGQSQPTDAPF